MRGRGVFGAALLGAAVGACVPDVGDLRDQPDPPVSPVGPLFAPRDAGPVSMPLVPVAPTQPVPTPITPVNPSPGLPELTGDGSLTLLHGVIDAELLAFCISVSTADDEDARVSVEPLPADGLTFGQALVVPMEGFIDPERSDVRVVAIATGRGGSVASCSEVLAEFGHTVPSGARAVEVPHLVPSLLGGASDAGTPPPADAGVAPVAVVDAGVLDAGPSSADTGADAGSDAGSQDAGGFDAGFELPAVRTGELPRFLPGTFENRSYLVVAGGCLGAPGLAHERESEICGPSFSRNRSSFNGIVAPLSRTTEFGQLGLQFLHASDGFGELNLRSNPGETEGTYLTVASSVVLGQIAPYSARRSVTVEGLGEPLDEVLLELSSGSSSSTLGQQPWPAALAPNRLALENGRAYTLVLIGPSVTAGSGAFWNAPMLTVVENDPVE